MGVTRTGRRVFVSCIAACAALPHAALADKVVDLEWTDLLPEGGAYVPTRFADIADHTSQAAPGAQPVSSGIRTDWNGTIVRLPGYIVPIDYKGNGVVAFLLVPFVGACIHVPPPPANQLVFVTTGTPYETKGLFEPVNVTGMFGAASTRTQLADVGYALSADKVEPFRT